jgi:hypothetical protein
VKGWLDRHEVFAMLQDKSLFDSKTSLLVTQGRMTPHVAPGKKDDDQ